MNITAVIQNGSIKPLEPLPEDWSEGTALVVTEPGEDVSEESLPDQDWLAEFTQMAREIEDDDFTSAEVEIQAHRATAKRHVVEEMARN